MPVQIGDKAHSFAEPTGLLTDCHRRIEMFLSSLEQIAQIIDRELAPEARNALENALRYFREAAPRHTADEEESLFPRLREMQNDGIKGALEQMKSLEEDHRWADQVHAQVDALGRKALKDSSLNASEAQSFREATSRLHAMYQKHIRFEDEVLFPLAARCLSTEDKSAMAHEMASRRKVPLVSL